jgi:uncharacterized protein YndB with AHSA1/START domain
MNDFATPGAYGVLTEPATLKIERTLPGPIERVWDYLTDSDKRRQWLASGKMEAKPGTGFELVWRNSELTNPPGSRPAGFGEEHRMQSQIVEFDPPHKLVFTWNNSGNVSIELTPKGNDVLLTLIHRRLPDRATLLRVAAGWHTHLDVLVARANAKQPAPYWDVWVKLQQDYDKRIPA